MANISRDSFDASKNFDKVIFQQGQPQTDYDLNEAQDITRNRIKNIINELIGSGSINDGWKITGTGASNDFTVKAGTIYKNGYRVSLAADSTASALGLALSTPVSNRTDRVYLDVYEVELDAAADPSMVHPALLEKGIEPTWRIKIMTDLKVAEGGEVPADTTTHFYFYLADINRTAENSVISAEMVVDKRSKAGSSGQFDPATGHDHDGLNSKGIKFGNLIEKPTTLSGYGITDAYDKSQIYSLLTQSSNGWDGGILHANTDGTVKIGRYLDFHNSSTSGYYSTRLECDTEDSLNFLGATEVKINGNEILTTLSSLSAGKLTEPSYIANGASKTYQSMIDVLRADRTAFLPASQVIIEQSIDGGITWTDAGISDTDKQRLFTGQRPVISIPLKNGVKSTDCILRVTITGMKYNVPSGTAEVDKYSYWNPTYATGVERYCTLNNAWVWVTDAQDDIYFKAEKATGAASDTWTSAGEGYMSGWAGGNQVSLVEGTLGGGTNQVNNIWNWRFTFRTCTIYGTFDDTKLNTTYKATSQTIYHIKLTGKDCWQNSNSLMYNDHLYSWDENKNAFFPAGLYATGGSFTGQTYLVNSNNHSLLLTNTTNPENTWRFGSSNSIWSCGDNRLVIGSDNTANRNELQIERTGTKLLEVLNSGLYFKANAVWHTASHPTNVAGYGITDALTIGNYKSYVPVVGNTSGTDLDTVVTSGMYRIMDSEANRPFNAVYGQLLVMHGGGDTVTQIYGQYNNGYLYTRSGNPASVGGYGSFTPWHLLLDNSNFNSYAPTLTGTGASGTWNIDISGKAATADYATNPTFNTGASTADNITTRTASGFWQSSTATKAEGWPVDSNDWCHLISCTHSNLDNYFAMQFAAGFHSSDIYSRVTANNGTTGWNKLLTTANYNSYTPTLTGTGASGTWSINVTGSANSATTASSARYLQCPDGSRNPDSVLPSSTGNALRLDFDSTTSIQTGIGGYVGLYSGVMTYAPWVGTTASTGDCSYQLAFLSTQRNAGTPRLAIRNGIDSTWNTWYEILTTANITPFLTWGNLQGKPTTLSDFGITDGLGATLGGSSFYGMVDPSGSTTNWIRTTTSGLLPSANGTSSLGTSSWKFASMYATTFVGSLSGNAATATKLATPVTINGVSFDGSASITVGASLVLTSKPATPVNGNIWIE
jgi:hypothetical protein